MVTANVVWTNAVGVQVTGNNLAQARSPGGLEYGRAVSTQGIVSQDGYVEFTATETTTDRMCGLSHGDSDQNYTDIDFAIYLTAMARCGCTRGAFLGATFGTYATGDVFRVALEGWRDQIPQERHGVLHEPGGADAAAAGGHVAEHVRVPR
jgi:hypothetical protein